MDMHVRQDTDTAHPQPLVPIYLIHSMNAPFCSKPGCWCKDHQAKVSTLLANAAIGTIHVMEAHNDGTVVSLSAD